LYDNQFDGTGGARAKAFINQGKQSLYNACAHISGGDVFYKDPKCGKKLGEAKKFVKRRSLIFHMHALPMPLQLDHFLQKFYCYQRELPDSDLDTEITLPLTVVLSKLIIACSAWASNGILTMPLQFDRPFTEFLLTTAEFTTP
jgi:hypothetical protein